jgi:hypothetical protein
LRKAWRVRRGVLVKVEDVQLTYVKPKITQIQYQYIVLTTDEYLHSEVFIVDVDKADKAKLEELIKRKYAARYRISEKDVEVKWLVELPKLSELR